MIKRISIQFLKLFILWILIFDFQRVLFSIHHWDKFEKIPFSEWFSAFVYSFKLDLSTAGALSIIPLVFLLLFYIFQKKVLKSIFYTLMFLEFLLVAMVHCGEINAYTEWNHKLTSRVFMHLANPDEVFRSADYSMTFWFFIYLFLEVVFSWKLFKWMFSHPPFPIIIHKYFIFPVYLLFLLFFGGISILFIRGGFQAIPININAAIFSKNPISNDLSINSVYYFAKSYLLYNRSEIDEFIPKMNDQKAQKIVANFYDYPKTHSELFLENKRPNLVFVVLESWVADAVG